MSKESLMLTGAPVTGKSTIYHEIVKRDSYFTAVPTETTRQPRLGEINGLDSVFLNVEEFCRRFNIGWYIEPNLEFTLYQGNHYGSPIKYFDRPKPNEPSNLFISVSIEMAKNIKSILQNDLIWVHLIASDISREERLLERGLPKEQIEKRLANVGGDSHLLVTDADLILDTSKLSLEQCLEAINGRTS